MGINNNLGYQPIKVPTTPEDANRLLARRGELIRLIHARKCPNIKNGVHDLFCKLCGGKELILYFQNDCDIFQETSPHAIEGDERKIYPYFTPISSVRQVDRRQPDSEGGIVTYDIDSFDDTIITLKNNGDLPKRYERIFVSYTFSNANKITNENSTHTDNSFIIETTGTLFNDAHIPATLKVHGDIVEVNRVYNVTKNFTYTVKKFKKNYIYLNNNISSDKKTQSTDILQVDYKYIPIFYAALLHIQTTNAVEKWGEDVKLGDIRAVLPTYFYVGRFSIITAMTTLLTAQEVITRGVLDYDEVPSFDVFEVIGNIEDEDNNIYTPDLFQIQEFNNLTWLSNIKPKQGKKYTINYRYRPSYVVYRDQSKNVHLGADARYPITTFARFFNKFSLKDFPQI